MGFNVSFRTIHWTRVSCQSNSRSLFLPCGKKPECPQKRTTASLLGTDKPKQAALKREGYTASSAQLNLHTSLSVCIIEQHCSQQEPQMLHVHRLFCKSKALSFYYQTYMDCKGSGSSSTRPEVKSARESSRPWVKPAWVNSAWCRFYCNLWKINVWSLINENIFSNWQTQALGWFN